MPRPNSPQSDDALPPQEVRILNLAVESQPDGRRVKVRLEITPFLQDPSIELNIEDIEGTEVSRVFIIETIDDHLLFTMHLKGAWRSDPYNLRARLYYEDLGTIHEQCLSFLIDAPES